MGSRSSVPDHMLLAEDPSPTLSVGRRLLQRWGSGFLASQEVKHVKFRARKHSNLTGRACTSVPSFNVLFSIASNLK